MIGGAKGIGIGIDFGIPNQYCRATSKPYIDPEVLASLVAVCICDGKSNNDPDRAIIKNLVDPDNPFVISNAAYKLNSGYGKYEIDFDTWLKSSKITFVNSESFNFTTDATWTLLYYKSDIGKDIPSFKVHVKLEGEGKVYYNYVNSEGVFVNDIITQGEYATPISYNTKYTGETPVNCGFSISSISDKCSGAITQIPSFQGALVTDGIDDLITSTKSVQEMLGGSNEITVISMIHEIGSKNAYTNVLRESGSNYIRNTSTADGKTGIYGYTCKDTTKSIITDILGDKNDYKLEYIQTTTPSTIDSVFSVAGWRENNGSMIVYPVAWYWTFIANKVLTTDQINQVIAYYNLDKYVKPDIYYDVKKQGLTNDTPDADWYLKDFSGNGRDMQLYNFAKKLDSGVGKWAADYTAWTKVNGVITTPTGFKIVEEISSNYWLLFIYNTIVPAHKVKVSGIPKGGKLKYMSNSVILENGINELPEMEATSARGFIIEKETTQLSDWTGLSVEQLPDYEEALVFDAVEDYGQFVGGLGLKDYTVAVDRAYAKLNDSQISITSQVNKNELNTPFTFESLLNGSYTSTVAYSFGNKNEIQLPYNADRKISYQSKYVYNSKVITSGNGDSTGNGLTFGCNGTKTQHSALCLWSFMLFSYSLSEFLLERQLKRYKLGTLYPNMVEWRPKVNINVPVVTPPTFSINNGSDIITNGQYISEGTEVTIRIFTTTDSSVVGINEATAKINGVNIELSPSGNKTYYGGKFIVSSKQKIDITIDEYIRYEDIVQPYPYIVKIRNNDGYIYTYGDKLKVGSEIIRGKVINLLPELYSVANGVFLNGQQITNSEGTVVVLKNMVFSHGGYTYLKANEPNCIADPQRLSIPNSSYKILGYIPDISGHGNHLRFKNFAFTEESGVNEDGSIHFDGVDDFITIPTLEKRGGKQVLMKVNYRLQNHSCTLYDQRIKESGWQETFAIVSTNSAVAYSTANSGKTYIDGILNTNIIGNTLANITHNLTIINENVNENNTGVINIGAQAEYKLFGNMSLFAFMSFPEISSEDEIKELNDIVGIEGGYVESPDYYWDAYGKANSDADRATIIDQVSKDPVNALVANNFAFNEESGYDGWLGVGDLTTALNYRGDTTTNNWKRGGTFLKGLNRNSGTGCGYAFAAWFDKANYILKFKIKITGLTDADELYICQYNIIDPEIKQQLFNGINEVILDLSASIEPTYQYISFRYPPLTNDVDFEFLYEYQNGLVSDGVDDHLINTVIPAFTDFTVIAKRQFLNSTLQNNETFCLKGDRLYSSGIGNAFLMEYSYDNTNNIISFGRYSQLPLETSQISYITPTSYNGNNIIRGTGDDNAGLMIGKCASVYWKGVFYKMMLYSKTIDMLSINMLKNLFERDELIDVNNPIFIQ